ncbi:uncharacterized protein LOC111366932 [Olea europaea var. sylvestris]|uniref:uncharacterized protein LOC111366932 n=1 Tax=Olea europaea var. sylvestris TaxID=158386 RepID=UPI000C1D666E|nr:uncharacterized protein LOC111366932 [Olea europaea var. sylvestris]
MATPTRQNFPNNQISISSVKSTLKVYSVPLLLFALSIFFQLIVVPRNFPTSHYDVLGIRKYSSIEEVNQAYEKITSKWDSNVEILPSVDLIEVRYAFELLTNKLLKRDYDIFNIDEHFHMIEKVKAQHTGARIYDIDLPLIKAAASDLEDVFSVINSQNFSSMFEDDKALLVQIISYGSNRCAQFSAYWKRIVNLLDGVTNTGVVELGDVQLAVYLAEKKSSAQPFFRNGLPALVSFPPGCKSSSCLQRYNGELSVDAITDWLATSILNLPRILYYSKESMVHNFLAKSKPHKVRVIFFSTTGERATPFIRQAAKDYWAYATFAFALWKEEDSSFWWNMYVDYLLYFLFSGCSNYNKPNAIPYELCVSRWLLTKLAKPSSFIPGLSPAMKKILTAALKVSELSTNLKRYNGSSEISEIIRWMSKTIEDGDSRELPPFKTKVPELSPEEADYFWSQPSEKFLSSGKSIRHWTSGLYLQISDWLSDPRIGPSLLFAAMISFSFIWLKLNRSQSTQPSNRDESSQSRVKDENRPKRRNRRKNDSNKLIPPSITDEEPKDAQQMRFSDSDSE